MLRHLSLLSISILLCNLSFAQINLTKPLQKPTNVAEPSTEVLMTKSVSWDMNQALKAGQWNPIMKPIHAPNERNEFDNEEIRQKTEQKLQIVRERTEPWIDEEGTSRSSSMVANPIVGESWQGLGVNGWSPPDNAGAISGAGNIVTCINSRIGYYDDQGNSLYDQSLSDFFSPISAGATVFDPKVEYSNYHNRFIVVALDGNTSSNSRVLIAFSKTSNPSDGFWMYAFSGNNCDSNSWFDYPNIGVSAQELFVSGNLFNDGSSFQQSVIFQIELADAWTGGTISRVTYCDVEENGLTNGNAFTVKPLSMGWTVTNNGIVLVSCDSNTDDFFYYYIDNSIGNSPSLNTYSCSGETNWSSQGDAQQLGSTQLLDGGGTRIRDGFYLDGKIYTVSGADRADGFGGIHYAEIEFSSGNMLDQMIWGGTETDYAYPSIEPWGTNSTSWDGTTVIGFLRSNSSMYPQFRVVKHNPDGTWGSSMLLKSGESSISSDRWGDYIDGCIRENSGQAEVWFFGQYGLNNSYGNWVTQLVEFETINGCTNSQACNYDPTATDDDGTCEFDTCAGCLDSSACNYLANATIIEICTYPGCTDNVACNYSPSAGCDDDNCCYGNCGSLWMFDSYGDGWNGSTLKISDEMGNIHFETTLTSTMGTGDMYEISVCLDPGCYLVNVSDNAWPDEVSWLLNMGGDGDLANWIIGGGAPENNLVIGVNQTANCFYGCTYPIALNYDAAAFVLFDNGLCEFETCDFSCVGDLDGDSFINTSDLLAFLAVFGTDC